MPEAHIIDYCPNWGLRNVRYELGVLAPESSTDRIEVLRIMDRQVVWVYCKYPFSLANVPNTTYLRQSTHYASTSTAASDRSVKIVSSQIHACFSMHVGLPYALPLDTLSGVFIAHML